jgi:hypothetical protein
VTQACPAKPVQSTRAPVPLSSGEAGQPLSQVQGRLAAREPSSLVHASMLLEHVFAVDVARKLGECANLNEALSRWDEQETAFGALFALGQHMEQALI